MKDLVRIFDNTRVFSVIVLAVLIITGGYLRIHALGSQPYWTDEGFTINATLSVLEHGTTVLDSGKPYSCATYCYPTAALTKVFGENAFSYRLLAALAGTALIALIFFIARQLFSFPVALFASAFTALSYYQIAWSRQARWYTLFELFFWLALFAFYKALYEEKKRTRIIYASLCAGATALAILTHGLGIGLLPIFLAWILIELLFIRKAVLALLPVLLALLAGSALLFFSGAATLLTSKIDFYYGVPYYVGFYLFTYWLFLVLGTVALWRCWGKTHARAVGLLILAIAAYAIVLMSMTQLIHYRYLFHLTPALFILAGLGLEELRQRYSRPKARAALVGLIFVLFFTIGGGILMPQSFYFLEADDPELLPGLSYYAYTPQPDWNAAYAYIAENRASSDIVISSMPQFNKIFLHEAGYWFKYDYLDAGDRERYVENDREYYVGATVVDDLAELKALASSRHGFFVLDYMATDGRIPQATLDYIDKNFEQVFYNRINYYSQVWVYRF
ncbi:MAG: glycosyltransferase family 39 protein [bacterium]|nr:glycosyltransferase family 39 protein [bacterium]